MKTLVIHPKDPTTDFLIEIYRGKDWTLINTKTSEEFLREQIIMHDRIVMLGHGSESGLYGFGEMTINSSCVDLLIDKYCVCIWCNADLFVQEHGLKGFYTGMIISETLEAWVCDVPADSNTINESNISFASAIKHAIDDENMLEKAKSLYAGNSEVVQYNRNNLYYNADAEYLSKMSTSVDELF